MSGQSASIDMVAKNKIVLSCSTPEYKADSPSPDTDSLCDSNSASPISFQCTQDGIDGETDVVWNFYTPKSKCKLKTDKEKPPRRKKSKRSLTPLLTEKYLTKQRVIKTTKKNTKLFQELATLNENLKELTSKKLHNVTKKAQSDSDDVFCESLENSPKSIKEPKLNCLRKNVVSSNVNTQENEYVIESDDSMNEFLLKGSELVEDIILNKGINTSKAIEERNTTINLKDANILNFQTNHDSIDYIMCNAKSESPKINNIKNKSFSLEDDSFDCLMRNINDSTLEHLTQININVLKKCNESSSKNVVSNSPLSKYFGRHNSMPDSPSFTDSRPSSSEMVFSRYSSMPYKKNSKTASDNTPTKCTPEEIRMKYQQAREKLMAKNVLPFKSLQRSQSISPSKPTQSKRQATFEVKTSQNSTNITELIERKRQEALMRLRLRQKQIHNSL